MSRVRLLVGTRKGAFILTADGTRKRWKVSGPHFAGWEIFHVKGSPLNPDRLYASQCSGWFGQLIQRSNDGGKHWDVMRSDNAGDSWQEVSGNLPTDFGFPIDVHAHEPETIYVVPIKSDAEHYPLKGRLRVYRSRTGGHDWEPLTKGLPQRNCYVNVLREAMAVVSGAEPYLVVGAVVGG